MAEERVAGFAADEWYGDVLPVYVGDDVTDEDAFRAIAPFGAVSVLVCPSGDKVERPQRDARDAAAPEGRGRRPGLRRRAGVARARPLLGVCMWWGFGICRAACCCAASGQPSSVSRSHRGVGGRLRLPERRPAPAADER